MMFNGKTFMAHVPSRGIEVEVVSKDGQASLAFGEGNRIPENTCRVGSAMVVKIPVETSLDKVLKGALAFPVARTIARKGFQLVLELGRDRSTI